VDAIRSDPRDSLIGLGLVLAGLPVYWIWKIMRGPAHPPHPSRTDSDS
jgi:hypothetical protein